MKVVALISGGKDSCYNMMKCAAAGHQIVALANLQPALDLKIDELDSYMFQTVGHEGIYLYAEAMGLPLFQGTTQGDSITKEMTYEPVEGDEVEDLYKLLSRVKEEVVGGVEGVASGAILSDYQRIRVENVCSRLGLVSLAYLWRREQRELLQEMIESEVHAVVIKVAAMGLTPKDHLGKSIKELYPELCALSQRYDLNVCGEGGEYETFTLDCPLFKKKIVVQSSEVIIHSDDAFAPVAYLKMTGLQLQDKISVVSDGTLCKLQQRAVPSSGAVCVDQLLPTHRHTQCLSATSGSTWVAWDADPTLPSLKDQTEALFKAVGACLETGGHMWQHVALVYLYISNMADYKLVNGIYGKYFARNPPARVCVGMALPRDVHVKVEMLVWDSQGNKEEGGVSVERRSMHVQSRSEWAPANIGPYSQAYTLGEVVLSAGQIGLEPAYMTMVPPLEQAHVSLTHVESVLKACHASLTSALCGTCYYTTEEACCTAKRALSERKMNGGGVRCPVCFVHVPSLPREACVEWHFIACQSSLEITCSSEHTYEEGTGLLTLQESWCPQRSAGSWLVTATKPAVYHQTSGLGDDDHHHDMISDLTTCLQLVLSQLCKHELSFHQVTVFRVCLPRHGYGHGLSCKDVQVCLESVSGQQGDGFPVSLLSTEDYWNHSSGVTVHALRI